MQRKLGHVLGNALPANFQLGFGLSPLLGSASDLAEPSRGPPSHEFVYEPFYDDLPIVEEEDVLYQFGTDPVSSEPMSAFPKSQKASAPV